MQIEELVDLRRQGYTLQAIGDLAGLTRERIRQRLYKYGGVKTSMLPEISAAGLLNCSVSRLRKLRKTSILSPIKKGVRFYYYDSAEMEKAMLALQRQCKHCNEPIPLLAQSRVYCSSCAKEERRYSYPFLTDEGKKRAHQSSNNWHRNHPERTKEISSKANKAWRIRHHDRILETERAKSRERISKAQYVVTYEGTLPVGTIFKAIRWEKGYLVTESGLKISTRIVRKLKERIKGGLQ